MHNSETIVAVATSAGRAGVGVVRVSGPKSFFIAKNLTDLNNISPRYANYTQFFDVEHNVLDQGILIYFQSPHSFTGEDVIEFQCHGSPVVLDQLVNACVSVGARIARPGEFSERAFLNDKIDLTQAEAIADLINANSIISARLAIRSLQGDFSKNIHNLNEQLVKLRLYVEAAIDFPEEDLDFLNDGYVENSLKNIQETLKKIRFNASQGVMVREGLTFVITGLPNVGKSTLLNQLAGRDLAIVTDIAGTTRDILRAEIKIGNLSVHIIDTAGLRESNDPIEQEGIKRAWDEVNQADSILWIQDITSPNQPDCEHQRVIEKISKTIPVICVWNKIDCTEIIPHVIDNNIYLSANSGLGLDLLKEKIQEIVGYQPTEGQFSARRRHLIALDLAHDFLTAGQVQLVQYRAGELLAEDLRQAHLALCEITGEFTSDDLLGVIFSNFCIGK